MPYDVAIVGAGPAGAASAIHFARAGLRVVLVDRATFPRHKACAEAISPAAEPLLHDLGIGDLLAAAHPNRLRGFRIIAPNGHSFQGEYAGIRDSDGHSIFTSGCVLSRYHLDAALVQGARCAGAEMRAGWRLGNLARRDDLYHLIPVGDQEPISARLVIAADGVHSTVARRLGLHQPGRMRKIALVTYLRGIRDLGEYGEMHVFGRRYVGLAPLEAPGNAPLCNVALVVDEARDGHTLAGHAEAFLLEALSTFPGLRNRLANLTVERQTLATSRITVHARQMTGEGLLLVGDAAGYYDPFTGEGIYRALRGAQLAAQVGIPAVKAHDVSAARLRPYEALQRQVFRGKRLIEQIVQTAVQTPPLMNHIARILQRRQDMADTIVAVTGDFVPASAVLRPGYLARLLF
jgi:flavin-dependent dehydrogenase